MKKWISIAAAFFLGVIVTLSAGDVSAKVKSLVGQKVTGEYTIVVDGKTLEDKGAVIEGRTNAPVRALSDALGADIKVSGKTVYVKSTQSEVGTEPDSGEDLTGDSGASNKYIGGSKESLTTLKTSIENNRIKPAKEGREKILEQLAQLESSEGGELTKQGIEALKKDLAEYDDILDKANEELRLVNEALDLLEK